LQSPHTRKFVLLACLGLVAIEARVRADKHEKLFVSAEDSGEVVVIDPKAGVVTGRVKVGHRPRGMRLSKDGRWLYVTLTGSPKIGPHGETTKATPGDRNRDGLAVVDTNDLNVAKVLKAGIDPIAVDLSPDGKMAFIANQESSQVTVVELATGATLGTTSVGSGPEGVTFRPNGKEVWIATTQAQEIYVLDSATRKLKMRVGAGSTPRTIVFTRDSRQAIVTDSQGSAFVLIDGLKNKFQKLVLMWQLKTTPVLRYVPQPYAAILSPNGKMLYASGGLGESIVGFDVEKGAVTQTIDDVGGMPRGIGVSRDGKTLFTANSASNDVSVVDIAASKVQKRIALSGGPWALVVSTN